MKSGDLFSPSWYRVASLKPRLRSHVRLHRHAYRGRQWFVLQDLATDRFHRLSPASYVLIGLMDGRRTVQDIWEAAIERLGDDAPTQHDVLNLISQLHSADALVCEIPPDTAELTRRAEKQARRKRWATVANVFAWRFPLCDPDRFLTRTVPLVRPFIGVFGALVWLLVVGSGLVLGAMHWTDLTRDVLDQMLAPKNLLVLWLLFPVLKLCHELGHAFITKAFGGEVHELGVMFLVFTPVPYVEASAAWAFREKWRRILVGAGGMVVELFLAALALWLWVGSEPGVLRLVAYNTVMIAGISTVLFNANPLLRFDGYYMLMDFLEIPNLKTRATRYLGYLVERYAFGNRDADLAPATPGERAWFVVYGTASSIYRAFVVVAILVFLGERFPLLAVLFAGLTAVAMIGVPAVKGLSYLLSNPRLRPVRARAWLVTAGTAVLLVGVMWTIPVPFHTRAEGVVWLPEDSIIRAETDGFIEAVQATPGTEVPPGRLLFTAVNRDLAAQRAVAEARLKELEARHAEQQPVNRFKAALLEQEIQYAREERDELSQRVAKLRVQNPRAGTFIVPKPSDLPGRFVKKGEVLGYVLDVDRLTVRAVVGQDAVDLVRHHVAGIEVRLAEQVADALPAALTRVVPAASSRLPSPALAIEGGGEVPMDPADREGQTAAQRMFQVDLVLAYRGDVVNAGGRVYVRFAHEPLPLAHQWGRSIRQLFLAHFNV
ncbi:PqqD family peptide modification chaperone [Candidatus Nitrospira bockiana]